MSFKTYLFCLILVLPFSTLAEEIDDPTSAENESVPQGTTKTNDMDRVGQVYSDYSTDSVNAANQMVSKLRDPTRISDSFRSALKRLSPQIDSKSSSPAAVLAVPEIELAAIIDGFGKERTALVRLNKKTTQMVRKGHSFTVVKGNVVYEIYVEDIGLCEIKLNVNPPNQLLILR